ncbi:hypothetical protein H2200_013053 [Cladophialophora chaetospira]|uniref:Major facilitator superfamily (MFS) profile domain-containing protein n=1 Tax=Cladophialophora chaetospira TaxID=386627 RepID=A0AA39CBT6_9EURO|nr:hypothetical protein H2200_013053 [Cladophialophora chaetospira]
MDNAARGDADPAERVYPLAGLSKDGVRSEGEHVEAVSEPASNLSYDEDEVKPELHARTFLALAAMWLLNLVQLFAIQGPPAVTWILTSLILAQTVLGPIIASASDAFQARKTLLVGSSVISFIGSAIAPGSKDISRLIAANVLIGVGLAAVPLAYSVPSEILPRSWRPMAQAFVNVAAVLGTIIAPLAIGALTKNHPHTGWRYFYWIQTGLWGATAICLFIGYRPPKRHTRLEQLPLRQKFVQLDLPGFFLLTIGLTLFLTGLGLGGGSYGWKSAITLSTLIIGGVIFIGFCIFEWKGTKTGILHHDLFRGGSANGRTFAIMLFVIFAEGVMIFSYIAFYPVMTTILFDSDPLVIVARSMPLWVAVILTVPIYGFASAKFKTIREPLFVGLLIATGGTIGLATIQPSDSTNALIFAGLAGIGYGAPLILIVAGIQLSTPHELIATATAVTTSSRAIGGSIFTAIYAVAFNDQITRLLPRYVARAAIKAGLPGSSVMPFVQALASGSPDALKDIPGVSPIIIGAGVQALKQAYADSLRVVFIIAAPIGALACIAALFVGDLRKTMNYHVDAPIEKLQPKKQGQA